MKKFLLYFCGFVIIFFIAPAICTAQPQKTSKQSEEKTKPQTVSVNQSEDSTVVQQENKKIRLLHSATNERAIK